MVIITEMNNSNNMMLPADAARGVPKFYDHATGIQLIRGGQTIGEGFFSSVLNSFYNIIYHFWGMLFAVLGFSILLSEYGTTSGPLELLLRALLQFIHDEHVPLLIRSLFTFLAWVLSYIIRYKYMVAYLMLLSVPAICKPSGRNFGFSAVVMLLAMLHYITFLQVMVLAILFYLFVMLRTPAHKFFIIILVVIVFALGTTTDKQSFVEQLKTFSVQNYDKKFSFKPIPLPDDIHKASIESGKPVKRSVDDQLEIDHMRELIDEYAKTISTLTAELNALKQKKETKDENNPTFSESFAFVPDALHRE